MRTKTTNTRAIFSAVAVGLLCSTATPAYAQVPVDEEMEDEDSVSVTTSATGQPAEDDTIVITGSRVRRTPDTFNSSSPMDVIGRDAVVFSGATSAADVLQNPTITSGTGQIDEGFLGYVTNGGPGANTVGLRGLGPERTLILLNGRRLAPAGAGPGLVSADLNVIPRALVQRYDILREGASAVYGSDAIAGVVNIITDTEFDGIALDFYTNQPLKSGGGRTYTASAVVGDSFDRGYITGSVEVRKSTGLRYNDRADFTCPTDGFVDANGNPVGQGSPDGSGIRCRPFEAAGLGTATNYMLGLSFETGLVDRFTYVNGDINQLQNVNNYDVRPLASPIQDMAHVIAPIETYTGFLTGAYEVTDSVEIYGEALVTRRKSRQETSSQISIDPNQLGDEEWGGDYYGYPLELFGYNTTPFFPNSVAGDPAVFGDGYNLLRVFIVPPLLENRQEVDFFRANAGFRGDLPISDWRFDVNIQHSRTDAEYITQNIDARKFAAALDPVLAPAGTPAELITTALPGQAGAGNDYTCAINVDGGGAFIPGSTCVPANIFAPSFLASNIPDNVMAYLYDDVTGTTRFGQTTIQAIVDGTLFELPAGPLGFAAGFEYRKDFINDVPDEISQSGNLYNYSSGVTTTGRDAVKEVFGEVVVPVLRDTPFFYDLTLNASGRWTDYDSYGSDFVYQFGGEWAIIPEFRIRGSYGTQFRAPNLFEQFVGDQSGFSSYDPCDDYRSTQDPNSNSYQNCDAELAGFLNSDTDNDGIADDFVSTGGPEIISKGGAGVLEAETSTSWGVGGVVSLAFGETDFDFAVDYFDIVVKDEVSQLGGIAILNRCYDSDDFRNGDFYCSLISPREAVQGNLDELDDPYLNVARREVNGVDFTLRFATPLFGWDFVTEARATRMIDQISQTDDTTEPFDYNGLLGYQGFSGGPKWSGTTNFRFTSPDDRWTLNYQIEYVGKMDSTEALQPDPILFRGVLVTSDQVAEAYDEHLISLQYRMPDVARFTVGVRNLFDEKPPEIGSYSTLSRRPTIGNYFRYSAYDFLGRSVFVNISTDF